jgi:hypothetical protein
MSAAYLETLLHHSRRVLELAAEGDTAALEAALAERRAHLANLPAAFPDGVPTEEALAEVRRLEAEALALLSHQRDEVGRELLDLRRGRTAMAGYRPVSSTNAEVARFLDQSG